MLYDDFVKKIVSKDKRNIFIKNNIIDKKYINIPEIYQYYNPLDVEFKFNSSIIRLVPISEFEDIQKEYSYVKADYIFGFSNGDPIFVKNQKVYTCLHGSKSVVYEELASSFENFIREVINK